MSTKLERLLAQVHPSRTLDETHRLADKALSSFRITSGRVRTRQEFKELMCRLFAHIESAVLDIRPPRRVHPEMDWSRCCHILKRAYGPEAMYVATQKALEGHEGGLLSVTRDLASLMAEEYAENEIRARVSNYWNGLTLDEKLRAPKEYLRLCGHLYPKDITEGSAARLHAFFPKFLEKHPFLLQRVSRAGR